jgi:hypothetical protein
VLPEEEELARHETEQAELRDRVAAAEEALETAKAETAQFQRRYYGAVGQLYADLDDLDAKIAELLSRKKPADRGLIERAIQARRRAEQTTQEIGKATAADGPPPEIPQSLKQVFRRAVKLMHPDLALTDHERQRRTKLMASVNLAYEGGDQATIEKLIEEFGSDPEAIVGEDIGSRIVKAVRRNAQLRRRLAEVQQEIDGLMSTDIFKLRQKIEDAEAAGQKPLEDLARQLRRRISVKHDQVEALRDAA